MLFNRGLLLALFVCIVLSCDDEPYDHNETTVSDSFESGNIGEVVQTGDAAWDFYIPDDNDNPDLPDAWRSWWYVKMEKIPVDVPVEITVKNSGWPFYYVPVYSYDQRIWIHFEEKEVTQNEANELIVKKKFEHTEVWVARFYPYTFSDLQNYLNRIKGNPCLKIEVPGYSQQGRAIYLLRITDPVIPVSEKKKVFIHARTHPAETPSSFLLEGMIDFLLSGNAEASDILSEFEFHIFPMQNVDGVIAGNYRSTPKSENLEVMWYFNSDSPFELTDEAPVEVTILYQYITMLVSDGDPPVYIALNLHASNSEPDIRTFFFPHFGTEEMGYTPGEASLWRDQLRFISCLASHAGSSMIEPVTEEGGNSFVSKTYPESWWWANFQDKVMAMTMEMTYGRAGYAPRWIEPGHFHNLGVFLAKAIRDYSDNSFIPVTAWHKSMNDRRMAGLNYPELYPPHAVDELKE